MPASDGPYGNDVEAAAERVRRRARRGRRAARTTAGCPAFDVLLLGVGPDTHVASLFPEHPGVRETERTVVGVHGAPKPPPTRISLTLPAIRAAREVWLLAAGEDKARGGRAGAVAAPGEIQAPAAGASGPAADAVAAGPGGRRPAAAAALSAGLRLTGCCERRRPGRVPPER